MRISLTVRVHPVTLLHMPPSYSPSPFHRTVVTILSQIRPIDGYAFRCLVVLFLGRGQHPLAPHLQAPPSPLDPSRVQGKHPRLARNGSNRWNVQDAGEFMCPFRNASLLPDGPRLHHRTSVPTFLAVFGLSIPVK
jgi:hypothetical protein